MSSGRNQGKDPVHAELADLRREINGLKQQLRQIPSRFPMTAAADGASIRETITQAAHGFAAGDVVYNSAGTWAKARANSDTAAGCYTGIIESVTTDTFVIVYAGHIDLSGLTAGATYYLSDATAGLMVVRATITTNALLIPVARAISTTVAIVMAARDQAGDLQKLMAGDLTDGGGTLRINVTATVSVDINSAGKLVITYDSSNTVTIDPADFVGTGKNVRLREWDTCDDTGTAKKVLVLASEEYT